MPPLPFPKSSSPGVLPGEGAGRRINGYIEGEGGSDRVRRSAGMTAVVDTGKTGPRGALLVGTDLFIVYTGSVVRISAANGVTTLTGSIPGSDRVTLARNIRTTAGVSTPDIVAVRSSGGAYVLTSSAVSAYPDADLPATVNSVEFMGGYFLFTAPDSRVFATELNSTDINPLSFTQAEARPDGLLRGVTIGSLFYAMGESTIEPYQNVALQPFPLQRSTSVLPVGIRSTHAIAGLGEGWDRPAAFVASDGTVRLLTGFDATIISTEAVARFIAASPAAELEANAYTLRDHAFWSISSSLGSWEYDLGRREWSERVSAGSTRWRGSAVVKRGADWIAADLLSGNIARIEDSRHEFGTPITMTIESGPLKEFPNRFASPSLFMDWSKAVGASVEISYSIDGGTVWYGPFVKPLDRADKYPVRKNQLALSTQHGIRVRAVLASAQDTSFGGATIEDIMARAA